MKTFREFYTLLCCVAHKRKYSLRTFAAVLVFFTTVYAMTIPAITMNDPLESTSASIEELLEEFAEESSEKTSEELSKESPEKYEEESEEKSTDDSVTGSDELKELKEEPPDDNTLTATASDGTEVSFSGDFPEDAEASVVPLKYTGEKLDEYLSQYLGESAVNDINSVAVYDISILVDGEEWEPEESISVIVKIPEFEDKQNIIVSHLVEKDGEKSAEDADTEIAKDGEISFAAESLSPWVFYTYTVDFYYNDAEYHLAGGTDILLSELFGELGIAESDADVTDVTFSDITLLSVEQQDSDWLLTSLQPFTTQETLTVTFSDGNTLVITVEDDDNNFTSYTYSGSDTFTLNRWYRAVDCAWQVDSNGILYIRPSEVTTKSTPMLKNYCPWNTGSFDARTYIKKAMFLTTTKGNIERYPYLAAQAGTMFSECTNLTEVDFTNARISNNTINMSYMFNKCTSLKKVTWGPNFNTSGVTNMEYMFFKCSAITSLDLRSFNTSKVTAMTAMFSGCSALTTLNISSFDTSSVTAMNTMFKDCTSLPELDVSNFNSSKAANMSSMFNNCKSLKSVIFGNSFTCENVTIMTTMFSDCQSLTSLDLSSCNTKSVTNMSYMFQKCYSLESLKLGSDFTCEKVTNMEYMFFACSSLIKLDLSSFNTSKVTTMTGMFNGCSALTELNVSSFDTSSVTAMNTMFKDCSSLLELNVSSFNTSKATTMNSMFNNCASLSSLDVSSFSTTAATVTTSMFYNCNSLESLTFGSNFICEKSTSMASMFYNCYDLKELDLSYFNPVLLKDSSYMFYGMSSLEKLDLSHFNTPSLTNAECMFGSMRSLTMIDISALDTRNVTGQNGSRGVVNLFGTGATDKALTTIKLGANTNFYPKQNYGCSFLRGTWRKDNNADYTSGEIAEMMVNNELFAGTYVRMNEQSLVPHYIVDYKIGDLTLAALENQEPVISGDENNIITVKLYDEYGNVTKSTVYNLSSDDACRWVNVNGACYLYVTLNSIEVSGDEVTIPHIEIEGLNVTWKWKNVVEKEDGSKYDFQLTQSGFTLYNVKYTKAETSKWFNISAQLADDFHLESFIRYESSKGVYSDAVNYNVNKVSSLQKAEMKVVDERGSAQEGTYTFASFDIDISSLRDTENGYNGYKYNSEGFYLLDGFYTDTLKYDTGKGGLIQDIGEVNINNAGVSNVLNITASSADKAYRITGSREDSGSEQSEFCIKVDASYSSYIWTGSHCGAVIMNGYQTEIFAVDKVDENDPGISLSGAELTLYQTHHYENGALIEEGASTLHPNGVHFETVKDNPKRFFLWPGIYKIVETKAPDCYIRKTDPVHYLITPDYYLYREDPNGTYSTIYTHKLTNVEKAAVINNKYTDPDSGVVYTATPYGNTYTIRITRNWTQVTTTSTDENLLTLAMENEPGARLPDTGGTGKMPFTSAFVLLPAILFAAFVFKKAWITRDDTT